MSEYLKNSLNQVNSTQNPQAKIQKLEEVINQIFSNKTIADIKKLIEYCKLICIYAR